MNQQKGFSLSEVLASLLLVSTLAIALLQQQGQSKQLLNQLLLRTQGTQFIDQVEEALSVPMKKTPTIPKPYHLQMQNANQALLIKLIWLEKVGLTRERSLSGGVS